MTGQWFLDRPADWEPTDDLAGFLAAGPPPVYVGFGSIAGRSPSATTSLVLKALQTTGQRGVIVTGWGGLCAMPAPASICFVESVPHDWLFPRMAAVVHHGGAGTTAEGLRFGKPAVVCPFFGDQPFWGRRVHALGAGPRPIAQKELTAEALADAIRVASTDTSMRRRAAELGHQLRSEDGVQCAVQAIHAELERRSMGGAL